MTTNGPQRNLDELRGYAMHNHAQHYGNRDRDIGYTGYNATATTRRYRDRDLHQVRDAPITQARDLGRRTTSNSPGVISAAIPQKERADAVVDEKPVVIEEHAIGQDGEHIVHKYLRGRFLGKGGFAKCYIVTCLDTQREFAGKIVAKATLVKTRAKQKLQTEIKIHRSLNHKHIVRFEHFFEDRKNVYLLMEICHNFTMTELLKRRKRLTEIEARYYMIQLLSALEYLHSHGVIHRDLKLGNLFLSKNMEIKVGDLGLAAKLIHPDERKKTICGTPNYIAPEILDSPDGHSFEVDIWSTGVILYTMLIGKPPYESTDVKTTYKRIRANLYTFPETRPVSDEAKSLIRRILQSDPAKRPTLQQIRSHRFFTGPGMYLPATMPVSSLAVMPVWETKSKSPLEPQKENQQPFLRRKPADTPNLQKRPLKPVVTQNQMLSKDDSYLHLKYTGAVLSKPVMSPPKLKRTNSAGNIRRRLLQEKHENEQTTTRTPDASSNVKKPSAGSGGTSSSPNESSRPETALYTRSSSSSTAKTASTTHSPSTSGHSTGEREDPARSPVQSRGESSPRESETPPLDVEEISPANPRMSKQSTPQSQTPSPREAAETPGILQKIHKVLTESFAQASREIAASSVKTSRTVSSPDEEISSQSPSLWVTKWVDYTSKYGLGYILNDGSSGVYFNDSTKIILSPDSEHFEYMERGRKTPSGETARVGQLLSDYDPALQKKVTLLKHFRNYLLEQEKRDGSTASVGSSSATSNLTFVKKWVRTRHAILFRLSNRTVQVKFFDHTEIVLSSEAQQVTYVDKQNNRITMTLQAALGPDCRADISKRLKYTKDVLYQMIVGARS